MFRSWLKVFRVVNLPTVPGDVFAGVASFALAGDCYSPALVAWAAGLSTLIYMFGLLDNDLVGAKTDGPCRPLAHGEITMKSAWSVWSLLLLAVPSVAFLVGMPVEWYSAAFLLLLAIVIYNRTKSAIVMGCCRGLNVGCGMAVAVGSSNAIWWDGRMLLPFAVAAVFTLYIAAVTKYSEGEERDPARRRRVGLLIGAHVYLQLVTLIVFALLAPSTTPLLVAGAVMLALLRLLKHTLPHISAS